jgi:hypothetical protein
LAASSPEESATNSLPNEVEVEAKDEESDPETQNVVADVTRKDG